MRLLPPEVAELYEDTGGGGLESASSGGPAAERAPPGLVNSLKNRQHMPAMEHDKESRNLQVDTIVIRNRKIQTVPHHSNSSCPEDRSDGWSQETDHA